MIHIKIMTPYKLGCYPNTERSESVISSMTTIINFSFLSDIEQSKSASEKVTFCDHRPIRNLQNANQIETSDYFT